MCCVMSVDKARHKCIAERSKPVHEVLYSVGFARNDSGAGRLSCAQLSAKEYIDQPLIHIITYSLLPGGTRDHYGQCLVKVKVCV